jgi:hypothetical protein
MFRRTVSRSRSYDHAESRLEAPESAAVARHTPSAASIIGGARSIERAPLPALPKRGGMAAPFIWPRRSPGHQNFRRSASHSSAPKRRKISRTVAPGGAAFARRVAVNDRSAASTARMISLRQRLGKIARR